VGSRNSSGVERPVASPTGTDGAGTSIGRRAFSGQTSRGIIAVDRATIGPSSPAPSTVPSPPRAAGAQKRLMKFGCGSGPIAAVLRQTSTKRIRVSVRSFGVRRLPRPCRRPTAACPDSPSADAPAPPRSLLLADEPSPVNGPERRERLGDPLGRRHTVELPRPQSGLATRRAGGSAYLPFLTNALARSSTSSRPACRPLMVGATRMCG
jgi:hypothetical protein